MRSPVIQYRIFTLMLLTAIVALMAALGLLLPPRVWIAFFLHAFVDGWRSSSGWLIIIAVVTVFVLAVRGLMSLLNLVRRGVARWLIERSVSRREIVLSRWLCGTASTAESIVERCVQLYDSAKFEDCVALLNVSIDVYPSEATLWHNRAACHYELGNIEATIDDATQVIFRDPSLTDARRFRAFALIAKKDWKAALEDLMKIQCSELGDAPYAMWRGRCHEHQGRWKEVVEDYRLSLQLDPEDVATMCNLARIYCACPVDEFRDGAEAIVLAIKGCKHSEFKDWISVSLLASAYAEFGDFKTSLVYAHRALELAPAEEKAERAQRIEQFEQGIPYRLPMPALSGEQ